MKNRPNDQARTVKSNNNHSTKSTPSVKAVINYLLTGEPLHHTDWTKAHGGEQHRLGLAIYSLRHKYGFLIECPRKRNDPLYGHYHILKSNIAEARQLAEYHGLI